MVGVAKPSKDKTSIGGRKYALRRRNPLRRGRGRGDRHRRATGRRRATTARSWSTTSSTVRSWARHTARSTGHGRGTRPRWPSSPGPPTGSRAASPPSPRHTSATDRASDSLHVMRDFTAEAAALDAADPLAATPRGALDPGPAPPRRVPRRELPGPPAHRTADRLRDSPRRVGRPADPRLGRAAGWTWPLTGRRPAGPRSRWAPHPARRSSADSTTVLLYKLARAAVDALPRAGATRSSSTPTTSPPTATSSRASRPSAG